MWSTFLNQLHILLLSFYYPPDIGPGSLRAKSIIDALSEEGPSDLKIDVLTTMPNRYYSYKILAKSLEQNEKLILHRIKVPKHKNKMLDQIRSYNSFLFSVLKLIKHKKYDIVVATSSRLITACLGAYIANKKNSKLYLDIRDLFADTMKSLLKKSIFRFFLPIIYKLEKWVFNSASKINVVSGGFLNYFEKYYPGIKPTVYTNGIDDYFLNYKFSRNIKNKKFKILYAGNIGDGQGLEKIIPEVASKNTNFKFKIIGDGSSRKILEKTELIKKSNNVVIKDPLSRDMLVKEYEKADILLIHLNNHLAFHRVLPSKIFEYAATNKPILAGVSGYAAKFLKEQLEGIEIFDPCDPESMCKSLKKIIEHPKLINRDKFFKKYKRKTIMQKLSKDILLLF